MLTGDTLVDRVGDDVRDAPPIARLRRIDAALDLTLAEDVPQPEFDAQPAVRLQRRHAMDQALRVDLPPIGEPGCRASQLLGRLDVSLRIDRSEQAAALEIVGDHVAQLPAGLRVRAGSEEGGDGDRYRHRATVAYFDADLGERRSHGADQCPTGGRNQQVTAAAPQLIR